MSGKPNFSQARKNSYHRNAFESLLSGLKSELGVLLVTLMFIFTLTFTILLFFGMFGPRLYYPAIAKTPEGLKTAVFASDSDDDKLPDVIEQSPEGSRVLDSDGAYVGTGTGTDPLRADTDGDFFPDGLENVIGTDPNLWFMPGFIWIVYSLTIAFLTYYFYFYKPDMLKMYEKNEELITGIKPVRTINFDEVYTLKNPNKQMTPSSVSDFRDTLAKGGVEKDDVTAMGFALERKRRAGTISVWSYLFAFIFILWTILDTIDLEINDAYDLYEIDRLLGAGIKFSFSIVCIISGIVNSARYRTADRRSRNLLKDIQRN